MASKTGTIGGLGIGKQASKGTVQTTLHYLPATSVGLNSAQQVQVLPPEIGGSYLPRGSYKAGTAASGDVSFIPRPDSLGYFLMALCGVDSPVTNEDMSSVADGTYTHTFSPFTPSASNDLPWMTLIKDTGKLYYERFFDCKLSNLRLDISKQSIVSASASFFGLTAQEVDVSVVTGETVDPGQPFQSCVATVALTDETSVLSLPATATQVERVSFDFTNQLSQDEYVVGAFTPVDSTLLQRSVTISYDIVIRDPVLRRAVYQNGVAPSGSPSVAAWSPTIFRGALSVALNGNTDITTSGSDPRTANLTVNIPGMDFMMMPVQVSGGQLIRATLQAQVTLGPSGSDQFSFDLTNLTATY